MKIKTGSTIFYFPPTALKLAFCKVKKEFAEENGIRPKAPAPVRTPVQTPFQTPGTTETTFLVSVLIPKPKMAIPYYRLVAEIRFQREKSVYQ